jgi:hypothetical protein
LKPVNAWNCLLSNKRQCTNLSRLHFNLGPRIGQKVRSGLRRRRRRHPQRASQIVSIAGQIFQGLGQFGNAALGGTERRVDTRKKGFENIRWLRQVFAKLLLIKW